ncbi:hypothetical protein FGB62_3g136 [Gracilaria domingensis]|nr:hypothetical protein FGB62_3g136 [Gracilaria domingensis]
MKVRLTIVTFATLLFARSTLAQATSTASNDRVRFTNVASAPFGKLRPVPSINGQGEAQGAELDVRSSTQQHFPPQAVVMNFLQPTRKENLQETSARVKANQTEKGTSMPSIPEALDGVFVNPTRSREESDSTHEVSYGYHPRPSANRAESHVENERRLNGNDSHEQTLDLEERKLKSATQKLVKWLRNRLRKRLEDVVQLESDMTTEQELLKTLSGEIEDESREREDEIKQKLQTKKELSDFRRHLNSPNARMKRVQSQTRALSEQLERVKEAYESMAARRKDLENKLESAGFSHWVEARGRDYFPDTAVGVLSKSAQVLGPVTHGFQRALLFDDRLSTEMEQIVPGSDETILHKIVWDITMMVPLFPFVLLLRFGTGMIHRLSVYDVVLCGSSLFAAECVLCFVMSMFFSREILGVCQEINETILVALLFINALLYFVMFVAQVLISCLRPSRTEVVQMILLFTVGCRYYQYVFQPVMLSKPVMVTVLSHVLYIVTFCLIFVEKKRTMNFKTSYDVCFHKTMALMKAWVSETGCAMRNVFSDAVPYGSRSDSESHYGSTSSFYGSLSNGDINSELHERLSAEALKASEYQKKETRAQPSTDYLGPNRWYPVNRSASLIRKTFTASQEYGDRMNSSSENSNKPGNTRKRSNSGSDDSVAYQSCIE